MSSTILFACSVFLGALGITLTIFSFYVMRVNLKLEVRLKEKDRIILQKEKLIKEKVKELKEKEGFVRMLREQIDIRDKKIRRLKVELFSQKIH